MPTTAQDARALAYLVKRLRDETQGANSWNDAGIWAIVSKLVGRNLAITVEQVTRHAADPEAKTPGAINRPFLPKQPSERRDRYVPPKRGEDCIRHPGQWAGSCGGCAADLAAGEATWLRPKAGDADVGITACRAALHPTTEETE
ncbi:MAG: hypothetical protein ACRDYZ_12035 [Acidimicrobiales bacterium]